MAIYTLIALLLASPIVAPTPDDDPEEEPPEESVVFVTPPRTSQAASVRYTPEYQTLFRPAIRGNIHTSFGYARVNTFFDSDGSTRDLFDTGDNGEIDWLSWNIMGSYDAVTIRDLKVRLGAGLSMHQRDVTGAIEESSGFGPQNVSIFGELIKPHWSFRTGFFYDFQRGQNPDDEPENSDGSHTINFSLTGQYPTERFRFFGGADYYVTLRGRTFDDAQNRSLEYQPGDIVQLHGGGGVRFGETVEAGLTLLFRYNREGQYDGINGSDLPDQFNGDEPTYEPSTAILLGAPNEFDTGHVLSLAPYVNYAPLELPLQFYLKGAMQREYNDYGFALFGENEFAPRLNATFGLIYEL